jgi:hypothetical protein
MNVKEAAFYFAEIMIKHFVFSIFIMAILAAHQTVAADKVDSGCLVQGSPWAASSDILLLRDPKNNLRGWVRKTTDDKERWEVFNLSDIEKQTQIKSDPSYFLERVYVSQTNKEGDPILERTWIAYIFARGQRGHLLEWRLEGKNLKWQLFDLTEAASGRTIAGAPSISSNGMSNFKLFPDDENFFTTSTPDDHLLRWSLPNFSPDDDLISDDKRVWSVVDLTNKSNGQTSAGNIVLDYWTRNIFTRDLKGHLLVGWQPFQYPSVDNESYGAGKIDLTVAVGGPTIIGDPTGYGDFVRFDKNDYYGFFQHVFARDSEGNLYEWRHIWEGEKRENITPYTQAWREAMKSGWQLSYLTEVVGGKTVGGDPAVYITVSQSKKNVATGYLNVLARGSKGHLLKWYVERGSMTEGFHFELKENRSWVFEDLTEAVGIGRIIIKGDPMMVMTNSYISSSAKPITERIFVEGENNHLLEWYREWESVEVEEEEESENWTSVVPPQSGWKVTDLTEHCNPIIGENLNPASLLDSDDSDDSDKYEHPFK